MAKVDYQNENNKSDINPYCGYCDCGRILVLPTLVRLFARENGDVRRP
jgi:aerobic-type carbon monoxide dehydrogenase small subunit (CoxS/CutS family)